MELVTHSYQAELEQARREVRRLLNKRAQLEGKIASLQASIATLDRLCGTPEGGGEASLADVIGSVINNGGVSAGLTDSCRRVLRAARRPLQSNEVVLVLEHSGFLTGRYVGPLSAVTTVMHRLVARGEATVVANSATGRPRFIWAAGSAGKKNRR